MTKHSRREEATEEVPQERAYNFSDLQKEMAGIPLGRMSFAGALRQTLGDENAVNWFYHTRVPSIKNQTPHEYVEKRGEDGKKSLASLAYTLIAERPD